MKRLEVEQKDDMIIAIRNEIVRSPDARYDHRLHGVLLVASGMSCYDTAKLLGHSPRSVESWVSSFNKKGFFALHDRERSGRPPRLSEDQIRKIDQDIRKSPSDFNYHQNFWDGVVLQRHIMDHYGVSIGVRQCQNLFHKLDFRLRKPRPVIAKADEEKKREFNNLNSLNFW
jgi:transposase